MLNTKDANKFGKVIAGALGKVEMTITNPALKSRWINAIAKAVYQIEAHGEFMTWMPETKSLLIWSQDSNDIHAANGVCDCEAYKRGFPCWHRAAARLVRLYIEAENNPAPVKTQADEMNTAPYLKPTIERKAERIGGIRIN
jgi:hypothetical protein